MDIFRKTAFAVHKKCSKIEVQSDVPLFFMAEIAERKG